MNYINKEKINYYKNIINNTSEIDVKTKIDKIDNSKKKNK
jgi:hypothetical protein